jgi:hypothetical protein
VLGTVGPSAFRKRRAELQPLQAALLQPSALFKSEQLLIIASGEALSSRYQRAVHRPAPCRGAALVQSRIHSADSLSTTVTGRLDNSPHPVLVPNTVHDR